MNIEHLHECARLFEMRVVESGFKRDLDDDLAYRPEEPEEDSQKK